jgi:hypothetical protein
MFNLIFVFVLALLGCIGLIIPNEYAANISFALFLFSFVWLFISTLSSLSYFSNQLERFEELRAKIKKVKINEKMQQELLLEFKFYLGEKYPNLEEKIFNDINKLEIKTIIKYPELKSSKTLIKLTNKINNLASNVYELMREIEDLSADIRYYENGKWEFIKPQIPLNLRNVIYS